MGRLAVIAGHSIAPADLAPEAQRTNMPTGGGAVELLDAGDFVLLPRHGIDRYVPAHLVDHPAHLAALVSLGCDRVLAISSVGGLRPELGVGTLLCPDDFIALHLGFSSFDDARGHVVPAFEPAWRRRVLEAFATAGAPPRDGGTYWQAIGPRFETPAEIRLIASHADVIGMTVASECVVASELGLPYAALCMVDNLASGLGAEPLTMAEYESGRDANRAAMAAALRAAVPALAE